MDTKIEKTKSLGYYHIQYGGVPMTEAGVARFATMAVMGGYTPEEIYDYLKGVD